MWSSPYSTMDVNRAAHACVEAKFDGEFYCEPLKHSENTKRIFSILAQLIALKTRTVALAITTAVRVQQWAYCRQLQ
jgi:hypothetical protein